MGKGKDTFDVRKYMFENRISFKEVNESKELGSAIDKLSDIMLEYNRQIGLLEYAASQEEIDEREFGKFKRKFDKVFEDYKKVAIKFGKKYNV